jgi:FixJ family two-component response regulator
MELQMKRDLLISIVVDDESMRESLESLLKSMGFRVSVFLAAEDFLHARAAERTDCLILDVRLGGMTGPELQRELATDFPWLPIIFITAHGSEALRQRLLADGAVHCLLKPFSEEKLLAAVATAAGQNRDAGVASSPHNPA